MALAKQLVPIVLAGGIDTKTDPKQVVPGKLLTLENASFISPKELKKAPGYSPLPTTILGNVTKSIGEGEGLIGYEGELLLASSNRLYSFSASSNAWADKGSLLSVSVNGYRVNRDAAGAGAADSAIYAVDKVGGLILFAWEEYSGGQTFVNYCVMDSGTQQMVVPSTRTPSVGGSPQGTSPRCFAFGPNLVLTWAGNGGSVISALPIPVASPQRTGSVVTVASDMAAGVYDACINITAPPFPGYPPGVSMYFAYNTSVASKLGLAFMSYGMVASSTNTASSTGDASKGVAIVPSALDTYSITYAGASSILNLVVSGGLTVVNAESTVETVAGVTNVGALFDGATTTAWYTVAGSPTWKSRTRTNRVVNGIPGTPTAFYPLYVASKPFVNNGITYLLMGYASGGVGIQNTYFLVDAAGNVQAKVLGNAAGGFPTTHGLPQVLQQADGSWLVATMIQDLLVSNVSVASQNLTQKTVSGTVEAANSLFSLAGVQAIELTIFTKGISYSRAEIADTLHIAGGYLSQYDGSRVVEHGFHLWPEQLSVTGTAGALTYSYIGVYEWTDAQGNRHQSAPSQAFQLPSVTAPNVNSHTITFPCLRVTQKTNVVLVVYATQGNGTQFFRVTDVLLPTLSNVAGGDTVTITNSLSDVALAAGQNLYTFGGTVENVSPPACSVLATGSNRLWALSSVNPLQVWYSKQVVPATPAQFSDLFVLNMDPRGGPITAIANMDDYQVFFKESSIFIVAGDGPDDTGQQNSFQSPKLVTTDSGCVDPRSVVLYPGGLLYKSEKGLYHLNRGLAAEYVGAEVEKYNSISVVSANLVSSVNQVRFNLADGTQLVYDYFMRQWSTRPLFGLVDAAVRESQYFYLDQNGIAYAENPASFAISGKSYALKLTTSWLAMAGINGFQRVYGMALIGDWRSPHTLRVSIAYDFNPTPSEIIDVTAEAIDPGFWGDGFTWGDGAPPADQPNLAVPGISSNYMVSPGGIVGSVAPADVPYALSLGYTPATDVQAAAAQASGVTKAQGTFVWGGFFPLYQYRINFARQKCAAVQVTIEDLQVGILNSLGQPALPGEGYTISNLSFIMGVKEGWNKVDAGRVAPVVSP